MKPWMGMAVGVAAGLMATAFAIGYAQILVAVGERFGVMGVAILTAVLCSAVLAAIGWISCRD